MMTDNQLCVMSKVVQVKETLRVLIMTTEDLFSGMQISKLALWKAVHETSLHTPVEGSAYETSLHTPVAGSARAALC